MTPRLLVIDTGASETSQPRLGRRHARAERRARYRVRKDASQSTFRIETALAARAERPQRTRERTVVKPKRTAAAKLPPVADDE
jgi:hypothetical protein